MSDIHALSGAYAVDALDDDEKVLFEAHLADCADCRAEVASLREASHLLASTTEVAPPPALRERLFDDIATVRPVPPVTPRRDDRVEVPRRRRAPVLLAAAAAAVLIGGGAVVALQPWDDDETTQQLSATEQVLTADDAEEVALDFPDGASATVVRSVSQGKAVLVTRNMPAAPEGKDYQLWLQSGDGAMVPAGLMPDRENQELLLDGDASRATGVGITVEPDGGSKAPTSDPIALFDFEQGA